MLDETGLSERAEIDALIVAFEKATRLARLLGFIRDKYFDGPRDDLNEYTIATEVFGRSKASFDSSQDAIVRVEAHRLRKRLKEYYNSEGRGNALRMSLPPGSYIPLFSPATAELKDGSDPSAAIGPDSVPPALQPAVLSEPRPRARSLFSRNPALVYGTLGMVTLAGTLIAAVYLNSGSRTGRVHQTERTSPVETDDVAGGGSDAIRILAGYSGTSQIDNSGALWGPDRFFYDGMAIQEPPGAVSKTSSPLLFQHARAGNFAYNIPVKKGVYELHLYFVATDPAELTRTFLVRINDQTVLQDFDIESDAFGSRVADERVFHDVSPASDGSIHLALINEQNYPILNAIAVLPTPTPSQLPVRIITRPTSFTDRLGHLWRPDDYFLDGHEQSEAKTISGTADPDLFATERYGHFSYTVPVDAGGRYTVVLYFAERYFGTQSPGSGGNGSRVFRVLCNGETLLDNFDIYKEAGALHALTKTFRGVRPSPLGKLNLIFEPVRNNATVSAIEVIEEDR
ncbi:MAG TPA: malectin domain-containing carbohydrate-binding protein [Terracidiphilus sp.]|jgi:hypothetical protein